MLIKNNVITFDRTGLTPLDSVYPYPQQLDNQGLLKLWLEADSGVTLSGSAPIAWLDQSSNAINFTNAGSPEPLTYATDLQNGLPGIYNNTGVAGASGEAYLGAASVTGATAQSPLDFDYNTPFSIVLALKVGAAFASGTSDQYLISNSAGAVGWSVDTNYGGSSGSIRFTLASVAGASAYISFTRANYSLAVGDTGSLIFTYDGSGNGSGIKAYVNGQLLPVTGTGTVTSTILSAGARQATVMCKSTYTSPDTAFVLGAASGALTAAQATLMDNYLNGKWALHS